MLKNCKDLNWNGITNLFLGFNNSNLDDSTGEKNQNQFFNFSKEHLANVLEGFWSGGSDRNLSSTAEIALITVYGFLIVAGLITNIVVGFVVARRKQMHTARNMYIVNLSVSDISLCLICMPFTLVMILRRRWTLGLTLCKLVSLLQGTNIMVSIGTITVIALDRYFAICKKSTRKITDTKRKVLTSIALIWIVSLLVAMPLFFYQVVEPVVIDHCVIYEVCIEQWPSHNHRVFYAVAILLIMAVIPPVVVGTVHAKIAKFLNIHAKTQKDSRRAQKELERNRKTTFLLSGIVIIFVVSWLPLSCFSLLADLESYPERSDSENLENSTHRIYVGLAIVHVIAMSSAVSNPIVYGWMNSNIRHEFLQLFPFKCNGVGKEKSERVFTGIENETTKTQINYNYNYVEDDKMVVTKECTALLVTLNEAKDPAMPMPGNAESL